MTTRTMRRRARQTKLTEAQEASRDPAASCCICLYYCEKASGPDRLLDVLVQSSTRASAATLFGLERDGTKGKILRERYPGPDQRLWGGRTSVASVIFATSCRCLFWRSWERASTYSNNRVTCGLAYRQSGKQCIITLAF